jgi:hypothetical protein
MNGSRMFNARSRRIGSPGSPFRGPLAADIVLAGVGLEELASIRLLALVLQTITSNTPYLPRDNRILAPRSS